MAALGHRQKEADYTEHVERHFSSFPLFVMFQTLFLFAVFCFVLVTCPFKEGETGRRHEGQR